MHEKVFLLRDSFTRKLQESSQEKPSTQKGLKGKRRTERKNVGSLPEASVQKRWVIEKGKKKISSLWGDIK